MAVKKVDTKQSSSTPEAAVVDTVDTESIDNQPVTTDESIDKQNGVMTSSTSQSLREKASIVFNSQKDVRLVTLEMANELFIANQQIPVKGKTSIKLTKQITKDRLESAGCSKIEVSHIDNDGDMVQSIVNSENFNSLANNVFVFTRLVAIASKCLPVSVVDNKTEFDSADIHTKAKKLMNRLCRSETVTQVEGKDVKSYHINLEYKPIKDFIRVVFSDKAKIEHGKKDDKGNKPKSNFFGICSGKSNSDIATLTGEIVSIISSNDSDSYLVTFGLKSEVLKDSGTKKFDKLLSWLQDYDSIYDVIERLKSEYPDANIELPADELAVAAG